METDYSMCPLHGLHVLIQYFIRSHPIISQVCWRRRLYKITTKPSNTVTRDICFSHWRSCILGFQFLVRQWKWTVDSMLPLGSLKGVGNPEPKPIGYIDYRDKTQTWREPTGYEGQLKKATLPIRPKISKLKLKMTTQHIFSFYRCKKLYSSLRKSTQKSTQ